jgi:hypothetical protein
MLRTGNLTVIGIAEGYDFDQSGLGHGEPVRPSLAADADDRQLYLLLPEQTFAPAYAKKRERRRSGKNLPPRRKHTVIHFSFHCFMLLFYVWNFITNPFY